MSYTCFYHGWGHTKMMQAANGRWFPYCYVCGGLAKKEGEKDTPVINPLDSSVEFNYNDVGT